ncbi:MAG: hypothetical protein HYV09_30295 [Deltaproteobacteria bacterium]|nr:hypothetical protein [Deltaproteobacteria bacterium]
MRTRAWLLPLLLLSMSRCAPSTEPTASSRASREIVTSLSRAFAMRPASTTVGLRARVPDTAEGALRLEVDAATWIELRPRDARAVPRRDEGGVAVYADAMADVDLVYVTEGARVEELRLAHTRAAAARSTWDVRLGPSVGALRVKDGRVEVLDAKGAVRIATEPAWAADANGVRRAVSLHVEGSTLVGTIDVEGLAAPIAVDPAWTAAAAVSPPRVFPIVAMLSTGKVLIAGGESPGLGALTTAELYDPATNSFTASKSTLKWGRPAMTKSWVVFDGGKKVLFTETHGGDSGPPPLDAEIYDATTDTFSVTAMPFMTRDHSATVLKDGKIVLVGGRDDGSTFPQAFRIFDPAVGTWRTELPAGPYGSFSRPFEGRVDHSAVLLADGKVMITGGRTVSGGSIPTERVSKDNMIWDPALPTSLAWKSALPTGRGGHAAYLLSRGATAGQVMVFGGFIQNLDESGTIPSSGGMLYDVATDKWTLGPLLASPRTFFASTMLADGRILITGGTSGIGSSFVASQTAEIFDGATWVSAGTMLTPRGAHSSAALGPKEVLLVGGVKQAIEGVPFFVSATERFTLQALGASCGAPGECDSGFCVDGVCCGSACAGRCEACDVAGSVGTCKPVKGNPRGKRPACDPTATPEDGCALSCDGVDTTACKYPATTTACGVATCVGGVERHVSTCDGAGKCGDVPRSCGDFVCGATACKTTCASKADCVNPNHFCSYGKCIPVGANGATCTTDEACASGSCVDGTCCESKCTGQCEACDVPGQLGKCVPIKGKPHGARAACAVDSADACKTAVCDGTNTAACAGTVGPCGAYACDGAALACKSACVGDGDCAKGYECDDGTCVPRTSKCTLDLTGLVGTDGKTVSCSPLLCRDGQCLPTCKSSADCQGGFICDPSGACVAPSPGDTGDDGGGCATSGPHGTRGGGALVLLALLLVARRRRPV